MAKKARAAALGVAVALLVTLTLHAPASSHEYHNWSVINHTGRPWELSTNRWRCIKEIRWPTRVAMPGKTVGFSVETEESGLCQIATSEFTLIISTENNSSLRYVFVKHAGFPWIKEDQSSTGTAHATLAYFLTGFTVSIHHG